MVSSLSRICDQQRNLPSLEVYCGGIEAADITDLLKAEVRCLERVYADLTLENGAGLRIGIRRLKAPDHTVHPLSD